MTNDLISEINCRPVQSWYDLESAEPRSPLEIIASASLFGTGGMETGSVLNSTSYNAPGTIWTLGAFPIAAPPVCSALETTNTLAIADAVEWNATHLTWNSLATLPPPLQTLLFLRSGERWQMTIYLNFGALTFHDIQLSFLDNAATAGDCHQTIPVIAFTQHVNTGPAMLQLTFKNVTGRFRMGIQALGIPMGYPPYWYMWETEWVLVT